MIIRRKFELFCDDATGDYGIAINNSSEHQFNAFWTGIGIFHDCFEHYFEGNTKPFVGDDAYTIWGEVAAMGAALQYVTELGVYNRKLNNRWHIRDSIFGTVYDMFQDAEYNKLEIGYAESMGFPLTKCPVKYQKPNDIDYNWQDVVGNGFRTIRCPEQYKQDIKNTMRWGSKLANKLYFKEMPWLIDELNRFTKEIEAEELYNMYITQIEFKFKVIRHKLIYSKVKFNTVNKWFNLKNFNLELLYDYEY